MQNYEKNFIGILVLSGSLNVVYHSGWGAQKEISGFESRNLCARASSGGWRRPARRQRSAMSKEADQLATMRRMIDKEMPVSCTAPANEEVSA